MAWSALHGLLTEPKCRTQRMSYDFGFGEIVILQAEYMALGLVINRIPSCKSIGFGWFGEL